MGNDVLVWDEFVDPVTHEPAYRAGPFLILRQRDGGYALCIMRAVSVEEEQRKGLWFTKTASDAMRDAEALAKDCARGPILAAAKELDWLAAHPAVYDVFKNDKAQDRRLGEAVGLADALKRIYSPK